MISYNVLNQCMHNANPSLYISRVTDVAWECLSLFSTKPLDDVEHLVQFPGSHLFMQPFGSSPYLPFTTWLVLTHTIVTHIDKDRDRSEFTVCEIVQICSLTHRSMFYVMKLSRMTMRSKGLKGKQFLNYL